MRIRTKDNNTKAKTTFRAIEVGDVFTLADSTGYDCVEDYHMKIPSISKSKINAIGVLNGELLSIEPDDYVIPCHADVSIDEMTQDEWDRKCESENDDD